MLIRPPLHVSILSIDRVDPNNYNVTMELHGKGRVVIGIKYFQSVLGDRAMTFDSDGVDGVDEARRMTGAIYPAIPLLAGGYANKMDKGEVLTFPIDVGDVSRLV